jgi:hypothetical protein
MTRSDDHDESQLEFAQNALAEIRHPDGTADDDARLIAFAEAEARQKNAGLDPDWRAKAEEADRQYAEEPERNRVAQCTCQARVDELQTQIDRLQVEVHELQMQVDELHDMILGREATPPPPSAPAPSVVPEILPERHSQKFLA